MYIGNERLLRDIETTDGTTDIVISAVTAWQMMPTGDLQIFLQGDTIFTVYSNQKAVLKHLRIHIG